MSKGPLTSGNVLFLFLLCFFVSESHAQLFVASEERLERIAERRLSEASELFASWKHLGVMRIDSLSLSRDDSRIELFFSPAVTHIPIRYPWLRYIETELMNMLGRRFRNYDLEIYAREQVLSEFIPNYFRGDYLPIDKRRVRQREDVAPLVTRVSAPVYENGLANNHIALWHSHGYYYDASLDRWQWQRARLFSSIEDMASMEYVVRYITPMLENAGANVLLPRERDIQTNEVIVDFDTSTAESEVIIHDLATNWADLPGGFAMKDTLFEGENPFQLGRYMQVPANSRSYIEYIPDIPESGYYAVYVSWADSNENIPDAEYIIKYSGGEAGFKVNQRMGFGTWVYLGTFFFKEGKDAAAGSIVLHSGSKYGGIVTADAVRFGGGMGNVARANIEGAIPDRRSADDAGSADGSDAAGPIADGDTVWKLSESPRYVEGARYYLQYAGMPDTLVYSLNDGRNDYNDDYMSRGEWVNYLVGSPLGPEKKRDVSGLGIPIDLSLSFHTDAGITKSDSVIGTLAIYSAQRDEGVFPDGVSRLAGRDLSDLVQDQLVRDIRTLVNPNWTRRALWDRQYSEAWRPNVPALLLELYSHQNLADIRHGFDPRFQFIAGRAIYKGILRFIAQQEGREAVVHPLPPRKMAIRKTEGKHIKISWEAVEDPLEPTASPAYFKVYTRKEGQGFDQGVITKENFLDFELPEWNTIFSFKVTALNSGGESFPTEVLSVALLPDSEKCVLIVNGFNRISGPGVFDTGSLAGITWWDDMIIPYKYSVSFTGMQYDFQRESPWLDDDSPGWGASFADMEKKIIPGNSFDYPFIHGSSIRNAGYSFVSMSREAFEQEAVDLDDYWAINVVMGKQKGIPSWLQNDSIEFRVFSDALVEKLIAYAATGGNMLVSGSHVGSDMVQFDDGNAISFAKEWLGYSWRTNHASNTGDVAPTTAARLSGWPALTFNTAWHPTIYTVEAPDAIEAFGENSYTIYRYASNKTSAAVVHDAGHKAITLGFPFETIIHENERDELMKKIFLYFENH